MRYRIATHQSLPKGKKQVVTVINEVKTIEWRKTVRFRMETSTLPREWKMQQPRLISLQEVASVFDVRLPGIMTLRDKFQSNEQATGFQLLSSVSINYKKYSLTKALALRRPNRHG